jgi:serine-type D-Ala-D-Ala carboxypeptidase/endopeptidase (penicillin-binding protein 4)
MKTKLLLIGCLIAHYCWGQSVTAKLNTALQQLAQDAQFKYATVGMYVINSETGALVFEKNAQLGMAPASSQKVVTSVTAFELLGKDYQYTTTLGYAGKINKDVLEGALLLTGSGDPTLGSWRYGGTKESVLLGKWLAAIKAKGIKTIAGSVLTDERIFTSNNTPDGWIWQDIGNYFGAGANGLNWRENQFDLLLQSGLKVGDPVAIKSTEPKLLGETLMLTNELRSGPKGSGDNAYVYLAPYTDNGFVRGTIPLGETNFTISGAIPNPPQLLADMLVEKLKAAGTEVRDMSGSFYGPIVEKKEMQFDVKPLVVHTSPTLDSINYWFLKKSINLYGEALLKTLAVQQQKPGHTDSGVAVVRQFWASRGIDKEALKVIDGSGLSPQNRVTAKALVTVLQYARNRPWFAGFYNALPFMNGLNMKDGYINGVRSYTGYSKSKSGVAYTFCLMVNNFDGSAGTAREKLWRVLDLLK